MTTVAPSGQASATVAGGQPLLAVRGLVAAYGPVTVLRGVDLDVGEGEVVAVLGPNGAGKTTLLRALSGGCRASGRATFAGRDLLGLAPDRVARLGIAHVPEGRGTFAELSVRDNLRIGAWRRRDRQQVVRDIDELLDRFPRLRERLDQPAGSLSGGEQQMLAIARGLVSAPRLLLLDEPSLGLSPRLTAELFQLLGELVRGRGVTALVVEQNARLALELADRGYVLEAGRVALAGRADELARDERVRKAYLGV